MAETRRSGLPALGASVSALRKDLDAGGTDLEIPPALPPKGPKTDRLPPKPKAVFPGPPQAFAMSGPRQTGQERQAGIAAIDGSRPRAETAAPIRPSAQLPPTGPVENRVGSRDPHAQSRSRTLPLVPAGADMSTSSTLMVCARGSPIIAHSPGSERSAVRTSSRPRAPRASTGGPGQLSSTPTSLRSIDTSTRTLSPVTPASPTGRPSLSSTPMSASPTDSLHPHSYSKNHVHVSPTSYRQQSRVRERSTSPSPTSRAGPPAATSIMDRPRPRTPEPASSPVFAAHSGSPSRLLVSRPSAPTILPAFAANPVFPGPPVPASKTSVLDRPRPKTPETLRQQRSATSSPSAVSSEHGAENRARKQTLTPVFSSKPRSGVLDPPSPKTPQPVASFDGGVPRGGLGPTSDAVAQAGSKSREPSPAPNVGSRSCDGEAAPPLPKDQTGGEFPRGTRHRPSVLDRPRPKTPDAASWLYSTDRRGTGIAGRHPGPSCSVATSATEFSSSSKSGSLDSIGTLSGGSSASVTLPTPTVLSFRPPTNETPSAQQRPSKSGSPLLKLDFDFGSTFNSAETMFGLSDFLLAGDAAPRQRSPTASTPRPVAETVARLDNVEGIVEPAVERSHEESEGETCGPPTPMQTSSVPPAPAPTPAEPLAAGPLVPPSGTVASDASPDLPKRKRRKSLASLLSFRSAGQSVDETHTLSAPVAGQLCTEQDEPYGETPPGFATVDSNKGEFSQALQSRGWCHAMAETAVNAVDPRNHARQHSYGLASLPDHSPKRGLGTSFQVVSATMSRRSTRNASGSVSSLHTSETDSSDLHRPSLDFGRLSSSGRPDGRPKITDSRHQRAPSGASTIGRRLVEKFSRGGGSRPSPTGAAQSWSAPLKDHSDIDSTGRPRLGRRRGSFSSLLGFGNGRGDASEQPEKSDAPKKLLGMSLAAGRRSEDLLTSGRSGLSGQARITRALDSRRSFDVLTNSRTRQSTIGDDPLVRPKQTSPYLPHRSDVVEFVQIISPGEGSRTGAQPSPDVAVGAPDAPRRLEVAAARAVGVSEVPASPTRLTTTVTDDSDEFENGEPTFVSATRTSLLGQAEREQLPDAFRPVPAEPTKIPDVTLAKAAEKRPPSLPPVVPLWRQQRTPHPTTAAAAAQASMSSAWMALEEAIGSYQHLLHEGRPERGGIISAVLLPFLRNEEQQGRTLISKRLGKRQRSVLFGWIETMTSELKRTQPVHRGALLEAVATILESHNLSIASLDGDAADQSRFRSAVVHILDFAIEKLNDKAVYANTLVFSGRILALAFFRVDGVALKLIRALPPVKRLTLRRVLQEAGIDENALPAVDRECYPSHLLPLCLTNFRDYAAQVLSPRGDSSENCKVLVHDGDVHLEMSGNWLLRWTASDSDLPFSFYRAYFRQLSSLLVPYELRGATVAEACLPAAHIITAPGFLFVAASLLDKSDALVHRNLRSVTSIGHSSNSFNMNDSANLAFGHKPKALELAQRRVTTTMLDVVGGPRAGHGNAVETAPDAATRRYLFGTMLQVWIRATVKRTSMWDQRGVFLLLDLIEGLIYTLAYPTAPMCDSVEDDDSAAHPDERSLDLLDIAFIFDFVRRILEEADNTVTIMRTIAFVYAHFEILTLRPPDRAKLCEGLILDESLFQRHFLHWNSGCRGFFIRLLVWRVSRLGSIARDISAPPTPDQSIVNIFNLLNARLEAIRKRHEQLEPSANLSGDDALFRPKRSTICSTRGVKEAPWALDEPGDEAGPASETDDALLATVPPPVPSVDVQLGGPERSDELKTAAENVKPERTAVSKVMSWLKGGRSKKSGRADRPKPIALPPNRPSAAAAQEWPTTSLPPETETGNVLRRREKPESPRSTGGATPTSLTRQGSSASTTSNSEKRPSRRSAFFAFEFENGVVSRADVDPNLLPSGESVTAIAAGGATSPPSTPDATSPTRPRSADRASTLSPRVSVRFSKRSSILPPAALDLLKSTAGIDEVPPIPERFRTAIETGYDKRLHPYAVRGLRDYEDALEEWTDWVARLQEEEEQAPSAFDIVPRLAVNWPLNSEEN
ncbi:hypothetical protein JCM3774_001659 [Rhodotorula dairenensis]